MKKLIWFILLSISVFSEYKTENSKVYYNNNQIKGINIKKFTVIRDGIAYDNKNLYLDGNLVDKNQEIKIEGLIMCSAPVEIVFDNPRCNPYLIKYNGGMEYYYYTSGNNEGIQYFMDMDKLVNVMGNLNYMVNTDNFRFPFVKVENNLN